MSSLGSLVVSLAMDTAKFTSGVSKAGRSMGQLSASAAKVGAAVGLAFTAGVGILSVFVMRSIRAADVQSKLAQSLGITAEKVSQLGYAAILSGSSQEELGTGLAKLDKLASDAASGLASAADVFTTVGINVKDATGGLKNTDVLLGELTDKFASYKDGAMKTALAMEFFGRSGARMIPFLNQGSAGLAEIAKEADLLGITLSTKAGKSAEQFNDNITRLTAAKDGLGRKIAELLLPMLERFTNKIFAAGKETDAFGKIATVAATGVKIMVSALAVIIGTVKTFGEYIGGTAAAAVQFFSGNWKMAATIMKFVGSDLKSNITGIINTVTGVWDDTALAVDKKADRNAGKIAAPIIKAASLAKKAGKSIKDEAQKIWEEIQKQLGQMQFDIDTRGASDRIKGLIELSRKGATPEQLERYLALSRAMEDYTKKTEASARANQEWAATMAEGATLTESLMTPVERLSAEYEHLNDLLNKHAINFTTYSRAIAESQKNFDEAQKRLAETETDVSKFAQKARENIQDSLGSGLYDLMTGNFKNIGDAFSKMVIRMVAEAQAAQIAKYLFGPAGGSGSGGGGVFGALLTTAATALFGGGPATPMASWAAANPALSGLGPNASGGVFGPSGKVNMFARGGMVNAPTPFLDARGGRNVMGEAGMEAIMPVGRGPDGKMGVKMYGKGGATNNHYTVNVYPRDYESFRRSEGQIKSQLGRMAADGGRFR